MTPVLEIKDVHYRFGGVKASDGLNVRIRKGTVHGLIGPNGAGKTTAFNLITGIYRPNSGQILLSGRNINNLPSDRRARLGIARTFQTPRLFEGMTVLDTIITGRYVHGRIGVLGSMLKLSAKSREEQRTRAEAQEIVRRVGLAAEAGTLACNLSYGHRRKLEIGRALALEPDIILLDEIAAGINPVETESIAHLIREICNSGVTVLLVEHDMPFVMGLCEDITVMNFGKTIAVGAPQEIQTNETVIEAYLGRSARKKNGKEG